jgi:phosphatidylserine/phosphatidylglycerophosphate/cardiolipin synthase-like enzyme
MFVSYTQKETNQIIYDEIKKASKYIHITTMFFNDDDLSLDFKKLLNHKIKEYPDIKIYINIGLNPFLKTNLSEYNLDKKIQLRFIPMNHLINTYHIRLFSTESIFAVGGIDITKANLVKHYIQFTLFIPIQNNVFISKTISKTINKTISNKNILYDFTENKKEYNISKIDPYAKVNELIDSSKHHIFIDNQYFFSTSFTTKLIEKKKNSPNIQIEVFSNDNFQNNVFKSENIFMKLVDNIKCNSFNMVKQKNIEKLKNEHIIAKTPPENKYTHNKLFIFDKKYILMGSMNIMDKSLKAYGGDIELCVLIKNKQLANEMLDYYKNNLF